MTIVIHGAPEANGPRQRGGSQVHEAAVLSRVRGGLDLVPCVGSRQGTLRWLAEFAGVYREDRPLLLVKRSGWLREQKHLQRELTRTRHWKRAAVAFYEGLLVELKAGFFDTSQGLPDTDAMRDVTQRLTRLQRMGGDGSRRSSRGG